MWWFCVFHNAFTRMCVCSGVSWLVQASGRVESEAIAVFRGAVRRLWIARHSKVSLRLALLYCGQHDFLLYSIGGVCVCVVVWWSRVSLACSHVVCHIAFYKVWCGIARWHVWQSWSIIRFSWTSELLQCTTTKSFFFFFTTLLILIFQDIWQCYQWFQWCQRINTGILLSSIFFSLFVVSCE